MNKEKILVSVLTPAYNAEKYISASIDSILKQTYKKFELIVIDDCSEDQTFSIIKKFSKKDKRIKYFKNKTNLGIAETRNRLLKKAKGKYIAWQDADDISKKDRLETECKYLEANSKVGIVGGYLQFFGEDGKHSVRKYLLKDSELRRNIYKFSPVAQPCAMIRKDCFIKAGLYDLDTPPAEDLDMSFRIGRYYKFANIGKILLMYREHSNSATFSKLRRIELLTIKIRKKYFSDPTYNFSIADRIYNILHYISIFIIPSKIKISLFNMLRNR